MTRTALLIVDVQNDFVPGVSVSTLPVDGGDQIIKPINKLMAEHEFDAIVATQDWHPPNHCSFKANGGDWPVHCVAGSWGAMIEPFLDTTKVDMILRKGTNPKIDSYSAFFENDGTTATGLAAWLLARNIERVAVCGLALDFCVRWTCEAARKVGFDVRLYRNLTRPVFPNMEAAVLRSLKAIGVTAIDA